MPERLSTEEIERLARKRAAAKIGWYFHAAVYVIVNTGLYFMSEQGFGIRRWSLGPVFGWGLGLALHGISVFILGQGSGLRENLVQRERERLQREQDRLDGR
ncbi:MAG TPA: 2TM domain-containing protein [Ramlibacter sp.]|uniref:2TM domain-containing protein n=1 Tax=Ramlibacter sp. TaxID=1917967 RepID=UPI002CFE237E|nr:2TM domain-containing protein [Ramlibacter sp.]HVZ46360.1 2TM domain-containing protein [Ramlibacter sp.]